MREKGKTGETMPPSCRTGTTRPAHCLRPGSTPESGVAWSSACGAASPVSGHPPGSGRAPKRGSATAHRPKKPPGRPCTCSAVRRRHVRIDAPERARARPGEDHTASSDGGEFQRHGQSRSSLLRRPTFEDGTHRHIALYIQNICQRGLGGHRRNETALHGDDDGGAPLDGHLFGWSVILCRKHPRGQPCSAPQHYMLT